MTKRTPRSRDIDRDRLYATLNVHPGIPSHQRIEMILTDLIDALCDEIEGK